MSSSSPTKATASPATKRSIIISQHLEKIYLAQKSKSKSKSESESESGTNKPLDSSSHNRFHLKGSHNRLHLKGLDSVDDSTIDMFFPPSARPPLYDQDDYPEGILGPLRF